MSETTMTEAVYEHPIFARVKAMAEPWRSHFPKSREEAELWMPTTQFRALAGRVLVVARTRIEGTWRAYCDAVPGMNHRAELSEVLNYGATVDEDVARVLFPAFEGVPYAR